MKTKNVVEPVAQTTEPEAEADQQYQEALAFLATIVVGYRDKSLLDLRLAQSLEKLQGMGVSQKTIALTFENSVSWVWKRQTILTLDPRVLEMMTEQVAPEDRLTYSNAELLTDVVGQPELQVSLAREILERRLSTTQARCLIKERADQAKVLLASDTEALEKEFKELFDLARIADEQFRAVSAAKASPFRFRVMLDAYDPEDVLKLQEFLVGCAEKCVAMAKMAQEHLAKE